jgi:hypothetical protein
MLERHLLLTRNDSVIYYCPLGFALVSDIHDSESA